MFNSLYELRKRAYGFLRGIPASLLNILGLGLNTSIEEYKKYIQRAEKVLHKSSSKHEKMRLQKKYDLPLRPNQEMRELKIIIRILEQKKKWDNGWQDEKDDKDNGFTI